MNPGEQTTAWQHFIRQPQTMWLRRAIFQVHLWSGVGFALYVVFISVTGSVLVYRNELYVAATPEPLVSTGSGARLSDGRLAEAAMRSYPGYQVTRIVRSLDPDEAVEVWLNRGDDTRKRRFDPYRGVDLGRSPPIGIWLVSTLITLHDDLLAGPRGRKVNGIGAFAVLLTALTGLVIWWPGIARWRRSLVVHRGVGWKRFTWDVHSMIGFWSVGFVLVSGASGIYLCVPEAVQAMADRLEPPTDANAGSRLVDSALLWLAYLHFGRINGIGIPCDGPGLCDHVTKAVWAVLGLAPAVMAATGTILWWHRVVRPWRQHASLSRPQ